MDKQRVVVCAANKNNDGLIICGARHYDGIMTPQMVNSAAYWTAESIEQGFIDNRGVFMTREEAWKVASDAGQIAYRVGGDEGKLFSENLY